MLPLEIGKSVLQFTYRPQTSHTTSSTCLLSAQLFYISMVIILGEIWAIVTISFLLHKCREYEVEIVSRIPYSKHIVSSGKFSSHLVSALFSYCQMKINFLTIYSIKRLRGWTFKSDKSPHILHVFSFTIDSRDYSITTLIPLSKIANRLIAFSIIFE